MPIQKIESENKSAQNLEKNNISRKYFLAFSSLNKLKDKILDKLKQVLNINQYNNINKSMKAYLSKVNPFDEVRVKYNKQWLIKANLFLTNYHHLILKLEYRYRIHPKNPKRINRKQEELKAKLKYTKTSIEGFKFRKWQKSDLSKFTKFVQSNVGNKLLLQKFLKANPCMWNPKGNPGLYMHQQCAETAIILLIQYCYKNKIDLVLPAANGFNRLSNYKTLEDFMKSTYTKYGVSHMFNGGGGILKRIKKEDVKPGDIITIKRGKKNSYHAQMVVSKFNNGNFDVIEGSQMNKDFKINKKIREKIEKLYPLGFIKEQPFTINPSAIKMAWGGYAIKPRIRAASKSLSDGAGIMMNGKDKIRYYRLNPSGLNKILSRII
jgi:hypothetical protein